MLDKLKKKMFRINVEGEMSSDEHCFFSDKDIVISKFCLNSSGVWNPIGEWEYDEVSVLNFAIFYLIMLYFKISC